MKNIFLPILVIALTFSLALSAPVSDKTILFREDFDTLDNWEPFYFPKIKNHSLYTIEKENDKRYLKAESHSSASAIVYKDSFNVYEFPRVRWRWKVMSVYSKGAPRTKAGDDYPLRIYIMFLYDPDKAGVIDRLKYGLAKKLYGQYPPDSSVSYVWANKEDPETIVTSPYTGKAKMILVESGPDRTGAWMNEEINILDDYRKAFGKNPPERASIAVMNDSDNTGESSVSYLDYLEVFR